MRKRAPAVNGRFISGRIPFFCILILFLQLVSADPPPNDACGNAQSIGVGQVTGTLTEATNDHAAAD